MDAWTVRGIGLDKLENVASRYPLVYGISFS